MEWRGGEWGLRSESQILKQSEEEKKRPKCVAKKRPSLAWGNMSVDVDGGDGSEAQQEDRLPPRARGDWL